MRSNVWGTCVLLGLLALSGIPARDVGAATGRMTPPATLQPAPQRTPVVVLAKRPDLMLEPPTHAVTGPLAFCVKEGDKWYARAVAYNRGTADVPSGIFVIHSKVVFSSGQTLTLNGPAKFAPPYYVEWEIPAACYQADCSFTIHLDYDNAVTESNENNNIVLGRCPPG